MTNRYWNFFGRKREAQAFIKAVFKKSNIHVPLRDAYEYLISPWDKYDWFISPVRLAQIIADKGVMDWRKDISVMQSQYTLPDWVPEIRWNF